MPERCPTCEQIIKPKPAPKRAGSTANSALSNERCPYCKATVLGGWIDSCHRLLNPDPLTELGELAMVATGRTTFALTGDHARVRDTYNRQTFPEGNITVHTIHLCGNPIPESLIHNPLTGKQLAHHLPDNPPY